MKSGSLDSICQMDLHGQEVDSMIDNVIDPNTFYYQTQCDIPLRTCSQMTFRLVDEDDHLYTSHYPIYVSILFKQIEVQQGVVGSVVAYKEVDYYT